MKTQTFIVAMVFGFATAFGQMTNTNNKLINRMDLLVPEIMEDHQIPGMALAIIDDGKVIHTKGYGVANLQENKAVTTSTGFNIGSISKLFTAFGIMKLVEEQRIDLDTPVDNYLTRWKLPKTTFDSQKVTIRHLMNHTAGISVHGYPGFTDKSQLPTLESSLDGNNGPAREDEKVEIIIEPQTTFTYSGGGYTLLQLVIEEVSNLSFEKFMDNTIFKPLHMKNTSFTIDQKILQNAAVPYNEKKEAVPFEYFTAKAAAGLQTTLDDFILFVDDMLHHHSIVSKESLDLMLTTTEVSGGKYGLGFMMLPLGPFVFKGHAGSNTGWQSAFFLDFKTNSGLIMMTNGDEGDKALKRVLKGWATTKYRK